MRSFANAAFALIGSLLLSAAGCTNIAATSYPVHFTPATLPTPELIIVRDGHVHLRKGYDVDKLRPGSMWREIGIVPQGHVFAPQGMAMVVKTGLATHNADLVLMQNRVIGIFLPAESAFVSIRKSSEIEFAKALP